MRLGAIKDEVLCSAVATARRRREVAAERNDEKISNESSYAVVRVQGKRPGGKPKRRRKPELKTPHKRVHPLRW